MSVTRKLTLIFVFTLMLTVCVGVASAGNAITASVWTTDEYGTISDHFNPGQEIRIYFSSYPDGSTVDVKVTDTNGVTVAGPWTNQLVADAPIIIADGLSGGYYFVVVTGAPTTFTIAVGTFNIVPESMFGTIAALGAGVIAFGTVAVIKRKHA